MMPHAKTPTHLLTDLLNIERRSGSPTPGRYPAEVWSTQAEDLRCALQPMKSPKRNAYGAERAGRMYTVFVAPGTGVQESDRLKISSNGVTRYLIVRSAPIDLIEGNVIVELDAEAMPGVPNG